MRPVEGSPLTAARRFGVWLVPTLWLALLLFWTTFETFDSNQYVRYRTAPFVWSYVAPKLPAGTFPQWLFLVPLALTVAGMFILLWCTIALRHSAGSTSARALPDPEAAQPAITPSLAYLRAALRAPYISGLSGRTCGWLLAVVAVLAAWQLAAPGFRASESTIADTFASMDHPFHIARAETLRQSLRSGESLRWVGSHQGGYPVEFYPFGFEYVVVGLWALMFGMLSIPAAYKAAVILLFLAPAPVYWWMARRDGWPPLVSLTAFAVHIVVAGGLWHGGYSELVYMGLGPNVGAAVAVLVALVAMTEALRGANRRAIGWAVLAAAAALWMNPRSGLGLVACGIGAWIATVAPVRTWETVRGVTRRLALIALLAGLLAAPEVGSLMRFSDLYYFIHYTSYASSMEYLSSSLDAASTPLFLLAGVGIFATVTMPIARPVTRSAVVALLVYSAGTMIFSFSERAAALVPQLETTRLMPLQRHLTVYLGAVGLHIVARLIATTLKRSALTAELLQVGGVAALALASLFGSGFAPAEVEGPATLARSGAPQMESLKQAIRAATAATRPDTAILVVGTGLSAHQQLWAPLLAGRMFFYDEWMWYWHRQHVGPYDSRWTAWYDADRISEVFSPPFLNDHGIGSVVVTGAVNEYAAASGNLRQILSGVYTTYFVEDATPIVTFEGRRPESVTIGNHHIAVETNADAGDVLLRRTWFPRWRAHVNGQPVPIKQTDGGYMQVAVPQGPVVLQLEYALQPLDWAARVAAVAGLTGVIIVIVSSRRPRRRLASAA